MFMNDENKRNGQAIKIARETTNNQKDIFILRYTDILPIVEFLWFLGGPFSLKTHLQESSPVRARQVLRTVEFRGELLSYKKITKARIRTSRGTSSLRVASQGLSHLFLKSFAAVSPDPTDRSWVSEDGS